MLFCFALIRTLYHIPAWLRSLTSSVTILFHLGEGGGAGQKLRMGDNFRATSSIIDTMQYVKKKQKHTRLKQMWFHDVIFRLTSLAMRGNMISPKWIGFSLSWGGKLLITVNSITSSNNEGWVCVSWTNCGAYSKTRTNITYTNHFSI